MAEPQPAPHSVNERDPAKRLARRMSPYSISAPGVCSMAHDEDLADRVRQALAATDAAPIEKKMFGGLAFMVGGHMTVGILGDELMVRVGKDAYDAALAQPHAHEMMFTGTPVTGMVAVGRDGLSDDRQLSAWVQRGLDFIATLPPK